MPENMKICIISGHEKVTLNIGGAFASGELSQITIEVLRSIENNSLNSRVITEPRRRFSGNDFYFFTKILEKKTGSPYHSVTVFLGVSF